MPVRAVVFDVGETLIDETSIWSAWADDLGVPRLTFHAVLGAVIARGGDHRDVFELFRPGIDLEAMLGDDAAARVVADITAADLYPDVTPCLADLAAHGYRLGVVGNQPSRAEAMFRDGPAAFELVASSATWGVAKPDPAFFGRIVEALDLPPGEIAYVGDRLDNDVGPAARAGMVAVFIRRGPWAWIVAGRSDPPEATIVIDDLGELRTAISRIA